MADPAAASDIPTRFDVALAGKGYVFLDTIQPSLPFRQHKAVYSLSPTFIDRSNISGNFGDDQQAWWLTSAQSDWSEGEEQRFFRQSNADSRSRYWRGNQVDITRPGQATINQNFISPAFASATYSVCGGPALTTTFFAVSLTDLFEVSSTGTVTSRGAHGAGNANLGGVAFDYGSLRVFIAGQTKVASYNTSTHTFGTFSATAAANLVFLNNTLYGTSSDLASLIRFDTAGVATTLYTWRDATGAAVGYQTTMVPFGSKLAILKQQSFNGGSELYLYDGVGVSLLAQFPTNFLGFGVTVQSGIIFVSGAYVVNSFGRYRSAVLFYANGNIGETWKSDKTTSSSAVSDICDYLNGVVFTDDSEGRFVFFDLGLGSFERIGSYTVGNTLNGSKLASNGSQILRVNNTTTGSFFPSATVASNASVITSLFDFDSSLDKFVRGIKVDFTSATDGDGGSVDIGYQLNSLDGTYSTVQLGAQSGVEASFSQSCRSISLLITLNKGTSTSGPILKRTYVRAAPVLQQFRRREFVLDCSGDGGLEARELRDATTMTRSGREQVNDLISLAQSTTPFSITDRFGTFTGLVDLNDPEGLQVYEIHQADDTPTLSGTYVVRVKLREV
jgi:hypothetical protein